jgi:hypothetical protein
MPEIVENGVQNSTDIFYQNGARPHFRYDAKRMGKEISLVTFSQLLARFRKRRAWQAGGEQIRSLELFA